MNKDFKSDIKDMDSYFQVNLKGDITTSDVFIFTEKAIKLSEQKNLYKYLVNLKQGIFTGTKQGFEVFVNFDMGLLMPNHPYKLAVLIDPGEMFNLFFVELLKNNDYNTRLFTDENEAKEWLLEG